jgi:hypothetical protein
MSRPALASVVCCMHSLPTLLLIIIAFFCLLSDVVAHFRKRALLCRAGRAGLLVEEEAPLK